MRKVDFSQIDFNNSNGTGVLKFFATWCVPCKAVSTTLRSPEFDSQDFTLFEVDVDLEMELADSYKINSVPTLVYVKDGREVKRVVGARVSVEDILKDLELIK